MRLGGRRKGERWGRDGGRRGKERWGRRKGGFWFSSQGWIPYGDFHVGILLETFISIYYIYWKNSTILTPSYIVIQ